MARPWDPTHVYTSAAEVVGPSIVRMIVSRASDPLLIVGPRAVEDENWREALVSLLERYKLDAVCVAPYKGDEFGRKMGVVEVATLLQRGEPVLGKHPDVVLYSGSRPDVTDRVMQGLRHFRMDLIKVVLNPEYCPSADYSFPNMKMDEFISNLNSI
ncbi:MAG: hypothetical protein GXO28_05375 [Methanopyri archaeon]|nr:hypothetical protein [Methanopyri archaeon]